jgi:hypothetical protein
LHIVPLAAPAKYFGELSETLLLNLDRLTRAQAAPIEQIHRIPTSVAELAQSSK